MTSATTSNDPLVEALATRLRLADVVAWQRVATWAEQAELSFEDLRLLLALAQTADEGAVAVPELAGLAGFELGVAYPAIHSLRRRGYLREDRRRYSLSERGLELVATLDEVHRVGVRAYVDQLGEDERQRLRRALVHTQPDVGK